MSKRHFAALAVTIAFALPLPLGAEGLPETVEFNRDIRPILSDKCITCHGPDEASRPTKLRLDHEAGAFVPLANGGRAIVRGSAGESEMLRRVTSEDPVLRMPPAYQGHERLSEREIGLLRRWIEQGARWQQHWSFIPPRRPAIPEASQAKWARNAIDHFVLRRLEREGLKPSAEADRRTLLRRVSLDLTGLPPTPREVEAFLNEPASDAYEKVVDRLLSSPRYGERMALPWLQAARYADTNGYQNDQERSMWRWRDWVIDAFNRNEPFDEFTIEQIAGDLLPGATVEQRIATGFNRNHRGNGELGIVPEEYHVEYVVDRVDTTATVWLGLTMGCARCHDHKYDLLTQQEFYRLYAYFNNVPDRGRYFKYGNTPPFVAAPTEEQQAALERLDGRLALLRDQLATGQRGAEKAQRKWERSLKKRSEPLDWSYERRLVAHFGFENESLEFREGEPAYGEGKLGRAARLDGSSYIDLGDQANFSFYDPFTLAAWIAPESAAGGLITRMKPEASARGSKGYGLYLAEGKLQLLMESSDIDDRVWVETEQALEMRRWQHVAATYDGSRLAKGIQIYVDGEPQPLRVIKDHSNNDIQAEDEPLRIGHGPGLEDRYQGLIDEVRIYDRSLDAEEVAVVATAESLDEIAAVPPDKRTAGQRNKMRWAFLNEHAPEAVRQAYRERQQLEVEREALVASFPTVMVMEEMEPPRETFLLRRGAYDAPGAKVSPGVPAVLPPMPAGEPNNRLGLARWLVGPANPLTARVTVNRFWQMLFGSGLVRTVEDFGSQGEWPTHPELLDWLAVEFVESGWDVKAILKTMVMSATYRQSSKVTAEGREKDPRNRLLSRGPRARLAAEAIRDQALAVAGLLVEEVGGPSVKPYQPGDWQVLSNAGEYKHDTGAGLYRRSLYTYWKRTIGPPNMLLFDSAARESCTVRETRTNTPLQALNLMNGVTYAEASRMLARRMMTEGGQTAEGRIAYGFQLATARRPRPGESEILRESFERYRQKYEAHPDDAAVYVSQGEFPRDSSLSAPEWAAYSAVASLILNLDETITKE